MGVGFGCQTLNCRTFTDSWERPEKPVKPIVLLCPVWLSGINI